MSVSSGAPPGWHPDPEDPTSLRWWDGTAWTEHRRANGHDLGTQMRAAVAADQILAAERARTRHYHLPHAYSATRLIKGMVLVGIAIVGAIGWLVTNLGDSDPVADLPEAATGTSPTGYYRPADGQCLQMWNADARLAAHRAMLGTRANLIVMVNRVDIDLPGALIPGGACGVVMFDSDTGASFAYASGVGGQDNSYTDVTGHAAARMLGRIHGPGDANAAINRDGKLAPL